MSEIKPYKCKCGRIHFTCAEKVQILDVWPSKEREIDRGMSCACCGAGDFHRSDCSYKRQGTMKLTDLMRLLEDLHVQCQGDDELPDNPEVRFVEAELYYVELHKVVVEDLQGEKIISIS